MIGKKIEAAINKQIGEEIYSGQLYLSMSSYFEFMNFSGFSNWAYIQYQGENSHAKRFIDHILDRNGKVTLDKVAAPQASWKSMLDAMEGSLAQEQKVTHLMHNLMNLARTEKDYEAEIMLQWFITEQIEEERDALKIVDKIKFLNGSTSGMLTLDRELADRKLLYGYQAGPASEHRVR